MASFLACAFGSAWEHPRGLHCKARQDPIMNVKTKAGRMAKLERRRFFWGAQQSHPIWPSLAGRVSSSGVAPKQGWSRSSLFQRPDTLRMLSAKCLLTIPAVVGRPKRRGRG